MNKSFLILLTIILLSISIPAIGQNGQEKGATIGVSFYGSNIGNGIGLTMWDGERFRWSFRASRYVHTKEAFMTGLQKHNLMYSGVYGIEGQYFFYQLDTNLKLYAPLTLEYNTASSTFGPLDLDLDKSLLLGTGIGIEKQFTLGSALGGIGLDVTGRYGTNEKYILNGNLSIRIYDLFK
ncbi:MAG: hypothetical protein ACQETE_00380 [Bacteroidota bacterium]